MASRSATASPFCNPEEDPFLLLESTLPSIKVVLMPRRDLPLRRSWSEQPYEFAEKPAERPRFPLRRGDQALIGLVLSASAAQEARLQASAPLELPDRCRLATPLGNRLFMPLPLLG